jgi:hypothetical protein
MYTTSAPNGYGGTTTTTRMTRAPSPMRLPEPASGPGYPTYYSSRGGPGPRGPPPPSSPVFPVRVPLNENVPPTQRPEAYPYAVPLGRGAPVPLAGPNAVRPYTARTTTTTSGAPDTGARGANGTNGATRAAAAGVGRSNGGPTTTTTTTTTTAIGGTRRAPPPPAVPAAVVPAVPMGRQTVITTTPVPVCAGGVCPMPASPPRRARSSKKARQPRLRTDAEIEAFLNEVVARRGVRTAVFTRLH